MRLSIHCILDSEEKLCISLYGESLPIETPHTDYVAGSDDLADTSQPPKRTWLGRACYSLRGCDVPPFLLIEQIADPLLGASDLLFLGQIILTPHELGEPIMIRFSEGVLRSWQRHVLMSPLHQQAMQHRKQAIDALFRLSLEDLPASIREQQQKALHHFHPLVVATSEGRDDLRRLLIHLSQVKPHWRPLPWLFSLLNYPDLSIQAQATTLLMPLAHLLPFERLDAIAFRADLPARVAALRLIGQSHHEQAETLLLATHWQAQPAIRSASLDGLVACQGDRLDLFAALETGLDDRHALVRWTAAWHLWHLAHLTFPPVMRQVLLNRLEQEPEALIRCFLHLALLHSVPWLR